MTDVNSKNGPVVEEVGLVDWIKSEPEDASDDEGLTWKNLSKKKSQPKARSKSKRKSKPKVSKDTTNNRKSKRQKTQDTPAPEQQIDEQIEPQVPKPKSKRKNNKSPTTNRKSKRQKAKDTLAPEQQVESQVNKRKSTRKNSKNPTINSKSKRNTKRKTKDTPAPEPQIEPQVLTEDEYIIAYIKEEVEEEQVLEFDNSRISFDDEINSNPVTPDVAIAASASIPEIKDEPPSSTEPLDSLASEPKVTTQLPPTVIPLPEEINPGSVTLSASGNYLCPICSHEYTSPLLLTIHLRAHSQNRNRTHPFACPDCPTICTSNWALAQHLNNCLEKLNKPIRGSGRPRNSESGPPIPLKSSPVKQIAEPQIKAAPKASEPKPTVSLNIHACPFCSKSYILPEYLTLHITSEHPDSELPSSVGDKQVQPVTESPASTAESALPQIKATKPHEPKPPVKGADNKRYLDNYLKHKCAQCPAKYHFPASLKRHLKLAHGQVGSPAPGPAKRKGRLPKEPKPKAPFELQACPHCQTEYSSKQSLGKHISRHHTPPDEEDARSRTCPECSLGPFKSQSILQKHLNTTHSRVKQYVCGHCEASFGEEVNLLKHLRETHTGVHPLCCAPCRLFFDSKGDTEDHLRTSAHTRPPFTCAACGTIVPSQDAQTQPCKLHRQRAPGKPVPVASVPVPPQETKPQESLETLRNTAGPSLESLAGKLGIAPAETPV